MRLFTVSTPAPVSAAISDELEPAFLMQQERLALRWRQRRERTCEARADFARADAHLGLVVARAGNRVERIVVAIGVVARRHELDVAASRASGRSSRLCAIR